MNLFNRYKSLLYNNRAFSLVELSIVLVILGLLSGGILTGQSLIRAAELRSVTTEFNRYQTAVRVFQDKYFALPGDMRNATDFWGTGICNTGTHSLVGTQTCNGNGDGLIDESTGNNEFGESYGFWQQMANAGLIQGSYIPIAGTGGYRNTMPGTNIPNAKFSGGAWYVRHIGITSGSAQTYATNYGQAYMLGAVNTNVPELPLFTQHEVWNIDTKADDGLPGQGNIIIRHRDECTEAADRNDLVSGYRLDRTDVRCGLYFIKAF